MEKILVRDISESGLPINDTISQNVFALTEDDYLRFIEPITVTGTIKRFDKTVLSDLQVSSKYASHCYRSLEKVQRDWKAKFTLDYELEPNQEYIELQEDIRQEIILRLPMRVLSDTEIEKDKLKNSSPDEQEDTPPENTYRPFAGLKDLE